MEAIEKHITDLKNLCNKHQIKNLYVFGSITDNSLTDESDIDFLIEFADVNVSEYFENYMSFKSALQVLFDRKIDVVEKQTLKNPVLKKAIEKNKILIYERADSEMAF